MAIKEELRALLETVNTLAFVNTDEIVRRLFDITENDSDLYDLFYEGVISYWQLQDLISTKELQYVKWTIEDIEDFNKEYFYIDDNQYARNLTAEDLINIIQELLNYK